MPRFSSVALDPRSGLVRRESKIANAGQGLWTTKEILKGQVITWYGGELLTHEEINFFGVPDTHLRSSGSRSYVWDGSLHNGRKELKLFDEAYYYDNKCLASFANARQGTHYRRNAQYVLCDRRPEDCCGERIPAHSVALVATCTIKPESEIFVQTYGPNHSINKLY